MQELLWKYVEGKCSQAELAEIDKLLSSDATAQQELDRILEVHSQLMAMEPATPSLRFTQNVMDALPELYTSSEAAPLISPLAQKLIFVAVGAFFAWIISAVKIPGQSNAALPYQDNIINFIETTALGLPSLTVQFSALTIVSLVVLIFFDKVLLRKVRGLMMI